MLRPPLRAYRLCALVVAVFVARLPARGTRNAERSGQPLDVATAQGRLNPPPVMPSKQLPSEEHKNVPSSWDLDQILLLLKTNVEEIGKEQPSFFGALKIEVNYREGEIETVIVNRRQTFKG
jgi:hypothetical protein